MPSLKLNTQAASQGTVVPLPPSAKPAAASAQTGHHSSIGNPAATGASSTAQTYTQPLSSSSPPTSSVRSQHQPHQPLPQAPSQSHQSQPHPRPPRPPPSAPAAPQSSPPSSRQSKAPQPTRPTAAAQTPPPPAATEADRPPVSPITPPLQPLKSKTPIPPPTIPTNFASLGGRAPLTHSSHPATVPSAVPPPVPLDPIDFNNNPDVIALQTTINILLRQKQQTERDIRKLRDAKDAAVQRPLEFARDLASGRVNQGGGAQGKQQQEQQNRQAVSSDDSDVEMKEEEDDDEDDDDDDNDNKDSKKYTNTGLKPSAMKASSSEKGKATASGSNAGVSGGAVSSSQSIPAAAPPWANLPKPQKIARCPPINWSQYAVEGEALDKLHAEQLARPTLGTPALMGANGTYEFTGVPNQDDGKHVDGIAAPFNPLRDRKPSKSSRPKRGV